MTGLNYIEGVNCIEGRTLSDSLFSELYRRALKLIYSDIHHGIHREYRLLEY